MVHRGCEVLGRGYGDGLGGPCLNVFLLRECVLWVGVANLPKLVLLFRLYVNKSLYSKLHPI